MNSISRLKSVLDKPKWNYMDDSFKWFLLLFFLLAKFKFYLFFSTVLSIVFYSSMAIKTMSIILNCAADWSNINNNILCNMSQRIWNINSNILISLIHLTFLLQIQCNDWYFQPKRNKCTKRLLLFFWCTLQMLLSLFCSYWNLKLGGKCIPRKWKGSSPYPIPGHQNMIYFIQKIALFMISIWWWLC